MLTHEQRQKINAKAELLTPEGLEKMATALFQNNHPDAAKHARYLATQKRMALNARSVPLEIVGDRKTRPVAHNYAQERQVVSPAAFHAVKIVSVIAGGGLFAAYVVIPALVALCETVVAVVVLAAPYIAGAFGLIVVGMLLLSGGGQKKTSGQNPGGNTYHIHINQGENIHVHQ